MELNQVSYFINLAETLNFTAAARLSGVSQPSLTRAIRRLEDELGGPLIYRDGKNSRLTGLGHDVEAEFRRMVVAMKSVRNHSEHWAMGGAPRAGCRRRAHRRTKGIYGILRERIGGDAIHRNQAALAPVERGHIGGAFRKIPRVHHAA
jgi:molybdenum-dependent DNA-binding transcriptional regulator ModE